MHPNTRRRLLVLLLAGLLALPALTAAAGGRHGGPSGLRGLERGIEKLDLPDDARERIDAILDEARPAERALRRQLRDAHERLRGLLEQDASDLQAVLAQADALGQLSTEAHKLKLRTLLEIRPLLTDEQREQLRERKRGRHGRPGARSLR